MKKKWKRFVLLTCLISILGIGNLVFQHRQLGEQLIRLHVVGASNTAEDQRIKLRVKDAVNRWISQQMPEVNGADQAKDWLNHNLSEIEKAANKALEQENVSHRAAVTLQKEAFPVRDYDTFSLPSGVYDALRITIGEGEGKNWWCVVFPTLCKGATTKAVHDTAAGAGFSDTLTDTLTQQKGYEVRFFLLDCIGKLENFFFGR